MKKLLLVWMVFLTNFSYAQKAEVKWLSFPELEIAITKNPQNVIINFYADWCVYCKKMENVVYTKPEVVKALNANYYAVRFNVESQDSIYFGGKIFSNIEAGKKRRAYHEIAQLLAGQKNKSLELPAIVILDENFTIMKRYFRYISPKEMLSILKN